MSIPVKFYTFSKKKNSTKRPSGGTTENCYLLDETSVTAPSIRLSYSGNPTSWNYAYIAYFHRYYFITDWVSDHNQWIATMAVDVLASFAADILASSQYVLRSASERNSSIADSSYPMDTSAVISRRDIGNIIEVVRRRNPFFVESIEDEHGHTVDPTRYVLAVTNGDSSPKICGVQYLCCEPAQLGAIMYGTLNPSSTYWDPGGSSGVSDSIFRSIVNPLQYFGEAYRLPFTPDDAFVENISPSDLKIGSWTVPYSGSPLKAFNGTYMQGTAITKYVYDKTVTVRIPTHPQRNIHGDYLLATPYSRYYLYAGIFGMILLDTTYLTRIGNEVTESTINLNVKCDFKGNAVLLVTSNDVYADAVLAKTFAKVSTDITLTQTKNNSIAWMGQAVGTAGNFLSGNYAGGISGAAGLISGTENLFNKPETRGQFESCAAIYEPWFIQAEFHQVVCRDGELPMNIIGYPLCETRQLSTLSGYCQTAEPWLDLDCYASEYNEIMGFMTDGFYIEEPSDG